MQHRRITRKLIPALPILLGVAGCFGPTPDCGSGDVKATIGNLFRRQLQFTPYIRFVDIAHAELVLESIFTVKSTDTASTCVAFVKYNIKLNDEGQRTERKNDLLYSLIYELGSEKPIYYSVKLADGKVVVHVDRVGG